jgi:hypothetical protein
MNGDEGRRACRVNCDAGATEIQQVGQSPAHDAVRYTGTAIRVEGFALSSLQKVIIVAMAVDADEYTGLASCYTLYCLTTRFKRLPGHFE